MDRMLQNMVRLLIVALALPFLCTAALWAQTPDGIVRGQVTDPSGLAIPAATVTLTGPGGAKLEAQTNEEGRYVFRHLVSGAYSVKINIKGFAEFSKSDIAVEHGRNAVVNAQLTVEMEKEQVTVQGEANQVSVAPSNNASALVLKGKDLNALSEDPDELQQELEALAGPAAGPNGGQIYIDGFTGGTLPPKEAILEVRVNQNPFSAQYDRLGYGRIDIITKPGYQKFHGGFFTFVNNSLFNSRNPFVTEEPNYHSEFLNGNVGGPLGKKASFFFDFFHGKRINNSIVVADVLDPSSLIPTSLNEAVRNPTTFNHFNPRVDLQLTSKNVLTVRGEFTNNDSQNGGIGRFNLPSQASNTNGNGNEFHVSDTQVVSDRTVTQTLFGYEHHHSVQTPLSLDPTLNVIGAFTGGGNSSGLFRDTTGHYEIRNTTSMSLGRHSVTYGGEVRRYSESVDTMRGYNGTFTFASLANYQTTLQDLALGMTPAQIESAGYGPSQFVITTGNPIASASVLDLALFAEDAWLVRPNISLTYGFRFETQNHISDHADFAPRLSLAWGLGGGNRPKTVLRAGFGIFYDRFGEAEVLQAQQLNGINQQRYVFNYPDFFFTIAPVPSPSSLPGAHLTSSSTVYQIDPTLRAPYTIESAASIERQITSKITTSVTYINSHGVHQLLTNNINAPLPGTYVVCAPGDTSCTPSPGVRPFGNIGNIYQYESVGIFNENQIIANINARLGTNLSFGGYYALSYANSDTGGVGSFPMNPYDIREDYGPATFAVRNRFFLHAFIGLPFGFEFDPFMVATSGQPYNITVGQDLFGTSIFNARPAFAAAGATGPGIVTTPIGNFDLYPTPGTPVVPINYLTGPSQFSMSARISKTFGFGKASGGGGFGSGHHYEGRGGGLGGRGLSGGGGGGGFFSHGNAENHRYQVEVGAMVHNLFNKVNLNTPVGNVTSPLFLQSTSLAGGFFGGGSANRSVNVFLRFSF